MSDIEETAAGAVEEEPVASTTVPAEAKSHDPAQHEPAPAGGTDGTDAVTPPAGAADNEELHSPSSGTGHGQGAEPQSAEPAEAESREAPPPPAPEAPTEDRPASAEHATGDAAAHVQPCPPALPATSTSEEHSGAPMEAPKPAGDAQGPAHGDEGRCSAAPPSSGREERAQEVRVGVCGWATHVVLLR